MAHRRRVALAESGSTQKPPHKPVGDQASGRCSARTKRGAARGPQRQTTLNLPGGPRRLSVWASFKTDPIRGQWLTVLVLVDAACGGLCVLAPAGDASQALLYVSGGLLLASACGVAVGFAVSGGIAGAFGWGALVATVLLATEHWTALIGVAVLALAWPAAQHALVMYEVGTGLDWARERRQRRR